MFNHELFAVTFARAVHVMRAQPPVLEQQKTALRAVHTLTSVAPAVVRVYGGVLSIDNVAIPDTVPHVADLIAQLTSHRVAEIAIAHGAAPGDLLALLRAVAVERGDMPAGESVAQRVRDAGATSVAVLSMPEPDEGGRRHRSVSQVFELEETLAAADAAWAETVAQPPDDSWSGPGLREIDLGFTADDLPVAVPPPAPGLPQPEPSMAAAVPAAPLPIPADTSLGRSLAALMAEPHSVRALDLLTDFSREFADAVAGDDMPVAVRAAAAVIELEPGAPEGTVRNSYGIVLKRMLPREILAQVAHLLLTADAPSATAVLHRAGAPAVDILLGLLAGADSIRERKAYMAALGGMPAGAEQVRHMLDHAQWYVVRNVADLCGVLRLESAVPDLDRLLRHPDARVQRAAAVALARIGTIDTVAPLLRIIKEPKPDLRRQVAAALAAAPELASLPVLTALAGDADKAVAAAAQGAIELLRQRTSGAHLADRR